MPNAEQLPVYTYTYEQSPYRQHWSMLVQGCLGHGGVLNHGSFGACPDAVRAAQSEIRDRFESEPTTFINEHWQPLLDAARLSVARFVDADPDGLVFVRNATEAVNAVVQSLDLVPGDELLTCDHEYNACNNVLHSAAARTGARVVEATVPFPLPQDAQCARRAIIDAYLERVTDRTRFALVSHVTSPTALIFPVLELQDALAARGVDLLVDGAHAPGMIDLDVEDINAPWYTANCHKWMCAPKGAAFLWTRKDKRATTKPVIISHGYNSKNAERSKYQIEFDWTGTHDPSAYLAIPAAIDAMQAMHPGGWPAIRTMNRSLALRGREILMEALGVETPAAPDELIGSIAAVELPVSERRSEASPGTAIGYAEPLQHTLVHQHGIQVPVIPWPAPPSRLIRISAQLYNHESEYHALAAALKHELFGDSDSPSR